MCQSIKYLSLCGMLGYGFPEDGLQQAINEDLAFIGVDSGSTDPGPYYLGSGKWFVKSMQVKRDLELALLAARGKKIPLIIGSAGGAGSKPHVDAFVEVVKELAHKHYLKFKMAVIYSDLDKALIKDALNAEKVSPCGFAHDLTMRDIDESRNPVGQFGVEPIIEALKNDADVIIAGRCCDTAIFASYPIWKGFDPGLAMHCAKIAECGALCATPVGANDSLLCEITEDSFTVEPVNPKRICTSQSVAAHSMYEQPNPECFYEPEGMVDMRNSTFIQHSDRSVKISGTVIRPPEKQTLKLEAARFVGYRSITIAGTCDPQVIANIKEFEHGVRKSVTENLKGIISADDFKLAFRRYGLDAVTFAENSAASVPHEIGLLIEVIAPSQQMADNIISLARSTALHQPFKGRKATAGNLAFPFSPSDFSGGEVYEFSIYHLMETDGILSLFPVSYITI